MIRIRISEDALRDLDDGFWFYEKRERGLGDYFTRHLKADIQGLKVTAGIHRREYQDYYRLLSRTFPFAIYYTLANEEVVVWAVTDCRRAPEWIRRHLDL